LILLGMATALGAGCQPEIYVDQNFRTNLGAEFVAPPQDADRGSTNDIDAGASESDGPG
jgi:hypothetical protein